MGPAQGCRELASATRWTSTAPTGNSQKPTPSLSAGNRTTLTLGDHTELALHKSPDKRKATRYLPLGSDERTEQLHTARAANRELT